METKQCSDCCEVKTLDKYTLNKGSRQGVYSMCKNCRSRRRTADPIKTLTASLKYSYGLTLLEYISILKQQDNRCYICKVDKPGGRGFWHIDHDRRCCPGQRTCGKCIRGILCVRCNLQVGGVEAILTKMDNSPEKMMEYIYRRI